MVDATVVATKVAAIRDAVVRIRHVLPPAAGFRNLVAHQYGVLDPARVHAIASTELGDLLDFCDRVSREAAAG